MAVRSSSHVLEIEINLQNAGMIQRLCPTLRVCAYVRSTDWRAALASCVHATLLPQPHPAEPWWEDLPLDLKDDPLGIHVCLVSNLAILLHSASFPHAAA